MKNKSHLPDEFNRQFISRLSTERHEPVDSQSLEDELWEIKREKTLSDREVDHLMVGIDGAKFHEQIERIYEEILREITLRLERSFSDSGDLKTFEIARELLEKARTIVEAGGLAAKYLETAAGAIAEYHPMRGVITTREVDPINFEWIVADLAKKGENEVLHTLHHEVIHHFQYTKGRYSGVKDLLDAMRPFVIAEIIQMIAMSSGLEVPHFTTFIMAGAAGLSVFKNKQVQHNRSLLVESQAHVGGTRYSGRTRNAFEIIERLRGAVYGLAKVPDLNRRVYSAVEDIERLYAIGVSEETIAQLDFDDRWNSKEGVYESLHAAAEALRKSSGYSEEELKKLVEADKLRRKVFVARVVKIAQDVIKERATDTKT